MTRRNGRKSPAPWLRQQAQQQRADRESRLARKTEQSIKEEEAKEFLTNLVKQFVEQQQRMARLAPAFADRCWRVHELYGQLKQEWERAEAAEARVKELEAALMETAKPKAKTSAKAGVAN